MERQPQPTGPFSWLTVLTAWSCQISALLAPLVVLAAGVLTVLLGFYAAANLSIDTSPGRMLDPSLPWRIQEHVLNEAFPQNNFALAVVVEGATPEIADEGARKLAEALRQRPDLFPMVHDPAGMPFLRRNALLFLDTMKVQEAADQLIRAQGLLGTLIADPTLNGLFGALNMTLRGVERGDIETDDIQKPIAAIADTLRSAFAGEPAFLSWREVMSGIDPNPIELYRTLTVKPKLDYHSLTPGAEASAEIRRLADELGLTPEYGLRVRLTGDVALDDEEFSSVRQGMGVAALLSFLLVLAILFAAVRSAKAVAAIVVTLLVGLVWSLAFAAFAVGSLNLVSVAFIVLFIGMAVDFGIQYCVRYRDESEGAPSVTQSARRTGRSIGGSLFLAAVTTAVGFLAFLPTSYKGVSELGIVAGGGMMIALALNVTLLPALIRLMGWRQKAENGGGNNGLFATPEADRWIAANRSRVLFGAVGLAVLAAVALPWLRFDFDPLNLKDPDAESVETLRDLVAAGGPGTNVMEILTRDRADLAVLKRKLEALPEVKSVTSLETFLPEDQPRKMEIIADAADLILPSYDLMGLTPSADEAATVSTIKETVSRLRALPGPKPDSFETLAALLDRAVSGPEHELGLLRRSLLAGLDPMLSSLALMLEPVGLTEESMPPALKADWLSADGQYRLLIESRNPRGGPGDILRFINAVRTVAPEAIGPAYFVQEAGKVVWTSFSEAFAYAFAGITILLFIALGRALDVALVMGPLVFAAILTLAASIVIGLPINFANVIALPLLMGVGVAFNIYFVANWRAGIRHPLSSSTARAVLLSALTTLTAFGALSVSPHAGTASMGQLLTLSLGFTLLSSLVLLPALLAQFQTGDAA